MKIMGRYGATEWVDGPNGPVEKAMNVLQWRNPLGVSEPKRVALRPRKESGLFAPVSGNPSFMNTVHGVYNITARAWQEHGLSIPSQEEDVGSLLGQAMVAKGLCDPNWSSQFTDDDIFNRDSVKKYIEKMRRLFNRSTAPTEEEKNELADACLQGFGKQTMEWWACAWRAFKRPNNEGLTKRSYLMPLMVSELGPLQQVAVGTVCRGSLLGPKTTEKILLVVGDGPPDERGRRLAEYIYTDTLHSQHFGIAMSECPACVAARRNLVVRAYRADRVAERPWLADLVTALNASWRQEVIGAEMF